MFSMTGMFSPGVLAGLAASAGLGVKSGMGGMMDAFRERARHRNGASEGMGTADSVSQGMERADRVYQLLRKDGFAEDAERLAKEIRLTADGLSNLNTLSKVTEASLESWRKGPAHLKAAE
jgi:hypothetical protein